MEKTAVIVPTTTPKKAGRPVNTGKRSPAMVAKICKLLATGLSFAGTARAVGLDQSTIHQWRKDCPDFAVAVGQAIAASEAELMDLAKAGARKDGRIALMMLERRHPEGWAKQDSATVQHLHAHGTFPAAFLEQMVEARRLRDAGVGSVTVEAIEVEGQ
jgi:hypothetical protein